MEFSYLAQMIAEVRTELAEARRERQEMRVDIIDLKIWRENQKIRQMSVPLWVAVGVGALVSLGSVFLSLLIAGRLF